MKTGSIHDLFREYQRRLDVRQVLEHYGAQNCSERPGTDGTTWIIHSCLLDRVEPHHSHGDASPSASVCIETGHYRCFVYWSGSIFQLVQILEGTSPEGALEIVTPFLKGATQDTEDLRKQIARAFSEKTAPPQPLSVYSERVLDDWMVSHPYMREIRGIDEKTHEFLKIGYDEKENRIVFPHLWHGKLVGWQKRAIPGDWRWPATVPDWPKYKNSPGFPKSETLYNYDTSHAEVLVVESPMSVARSYSIGWLYPGGGLGIVATFGASVSQTQIDLLKDYHRVYVWFDADPAGFAGAHKLVEGLYRHTNVLVIEPEEGRDLGDYAHGREADEKIKDAKPAALWLRR